MAILKCKMCGADVTLIEGSTVVECESCGTQQTVPSADNEKKLSLFTRANRLRATCDFDKAAGVYETIVGEYPEEAEGYWGLVLCKYGIEYVDDPATGKKIPTCHRSSFESVMDDSNFEMAMEYADVVALNVYRQEAKQIEHIRKGILEVSSKEEPYDIFICYKETGFDGDRTLDSVIAQDIYDALTDKGYRVFFSRITLEDKIGEAYEPYIFAALNSAKVMLAVGTKFEYYNAVWVKNEWSRYLKICAADKSKHLIPCYKNLDAYDIPKEFQHLQAQDMGKMGAIQDLLRGIEKYIPLNKSQTIIQEKIVVGGSGSGDGKIASLLDRGNMALEDGDWAKADSFFEDVLNNDSKNAQAYLGKTLAQERCRTLDAFIRKRKEATEYVAQDDIYIPKATSHINDMIEKYCLPGYLEAKAIEALYEDLWVCVTEVPGREAQYKEEVQYWENHKQLSRAQKFATGAMAEHLASAKKTLLAELANRVAKAKEDEAKQKVQYEQEYAEYLADADVKAERMYQQALKAREEYYEGLLKVAKTSCDIEMLGSTARSFEQLGDYQDSKNLAEHCRKRIAEEKTKIAEEQERQRVLRERAEKERQAKNKKMTIIGVAAAAVVIAIILVVTKVIIPSGNYKKADAMLASGQYEDAKAMFEDLGGFKDSEAKAKEAADAIAAAEVERIAQEIADNYSKAQSLMEAGDYQAALEILAGLGDYENSSELIAQLQQEIDYATAISYLESNQDADAYALLQKLGDFKDAKSYLEKFEPILTKREHEYSDGWVDTGVYSYDEQNRLIKIKKEHSTTEFTYHSNGTLSEMEIGGPDIVTHLHKYNEKGHPIFFGWLNPIKETYNQYWRFEYTYDENGNVTRIAGFNTQDGTDGTVENWSVELSTGDSIEIADLVVGSADRFDTARLSPYIHILRANGTVREEYLFLADKDYVSYYVYDLDEHGNATKQTYYYKYSMVDYIATRESTQEYNLVYNAKGQLEKMYYSTDSGNYNYEYTYDDNGYVTNVSYENGSDVFEYAWVYTE